MEAAKNDNRITKEYYYFLKGEMNRGTTKKIVQRVVHQHGNLKYESYHLVFNG